MIGVYKITNTINGKCYIGKSLNIEYRLTEHKINSSNEPLRNAIKKYGIENFTFEVLEECTKENYGERERYWIAYYDSMKPSGYNLTSGGENEPGFKMSEETKQKMSESAKRVDYSYRIGNKNGVGNENTKGKIWINNGEKSFMINPNDLDKYLSEGFVRGRLKGRIWVNNTNKSKMIDRNELNMYLSQGWKLGRIYKKKGNN